MNDPRLPTVPAAQPAPSTLVPGPPQAEITSVEAVKMTDWTREDVKSGKLSRKQAEKIFDDLAVPEDQRTTEEVRTDEQILLDQHFLSRGATGRLRDSVEPPRRPHAAVARNESPRHVGPWLAGAEFPRELGNSLISTIEKVAQQTKAMSPEQHEQYGFDEFAKLEHAYGPVLDDKLRAAGRMVEDLDQKTPGLKNVLKSKGLGDNAMIASLLIQQSERYHARRRR